MSKMKEIFQQERELSSHQDEFLDAEWEQEVVSTHNRQRQMLNEIFEAWGEIFGVKDVKSKSNNEDENF